MNFSFYSRVATHSFLFAYSYSGREFNNVLCVWLNIIFFPVFKMLRNLNAISFIQSIIYLNILIHHLRTQIILLPKRLEWESNSCISENGLTTNHEWLNEHKQQPNHIWKERKRPNKNRTNQKSLKEENRTMNTFLEFIC